MRVTVALACAALVALVAVWAEPAAAADECPVGPNGKPCAGNGDCVNGECQCSGRFIAPDCVKQGCPKGCSGNGKCNTESGECTCEAGFVGDDCADKAPECPKSADGTECGGHGECDTATGKCACLERWSGAACTNPECDPLCVEGSHGSCDKGTCVCDTGFRGDVCQSKTCPGLVRRPRKPADSPNPRSEVGVSLDDDARRRAKLPAVVAEEEASASSGSQEDARFRSFSASSPAAPVSGGAHDISLAAAAEREALTAQGALAFGDSGSSLLQAGASESESDETAAAILAAAGAIDQDPLASPPQASAPMPVPVVESPSQDTEETAAEQAPPAGIAEGLSVWRFRERRAALHTSTGATVPAVDADAAIKAALGLAGDDSVLARAAAEQDARFAGHSMLRREDKDQSKDAAAAEFEEESREAGDMVVEYCNGHGLCRGDGTCECDQGFAGDACETRTCPGNCTGNGACDSATGQCSCKVGFYGDACAQRRCPGLVELEDPDLPHVECTGHGDCDSGTGTCSCHAPWLGADCAEKACPGVVSLTDQERSLDPLNRTQVPCSMHGQCMQSPEPGTCKCADGWTGTACATSACGDSHCNSRLGRGECHTVEQESESESEDADSGSEDGEAPAVGVCHCAPGFTGEHCELALCPGAGGGCSGHGRCDSQTGVCACDGAWGGPACRLPEVQHGIVVGKRYPLSLYAKLRKHERNRAEVVAKLAHESAAEAAHEASKRRHADAKRIAHEEAEESSEQTTVADILSTASDQDSAALLQRVASSRTRTHKGGAVLSASEDEVAPAGNETAAEGDAAETDSSEEVKAEASADAAEAEASADAAGDKAAAAEDKADKALEGHKDSPSASELKTQTKLAAVEALLKNSDESAASLKAKQPLEADAYGEDGEMASPADQKAEVGVPSTIADALAVTHSRVQLRRKAGLDADPESVTMETAQAGGGADDTVVFLTRCDPGWTGPTCSERVSSFRCNGGAGCGEHGNCTKWGCLCDRGWSGFDCSIPAAKLACPVGVPAEAEGYYRHLVELEESEKERTESLARQYRTHHKEAAAEAKQLLAEMDHERADKQGAILAGEEVPVEGAAAAAADSEAADAAKAEAKAAKEVEQAKAELAKEEEEAALKDEMEAEDKDEDAEASPEAVTEAEADAESIEKELANAEEAEQEAADEAEEAEPSFLQRVARSFGLASSGARRNRHSHGGRGHRHHAKHHRHRPHAQRFRSLEESDTASVVEGDEGVPQTGKAAELAEMQAAMKAMESLKDVQAKMRERHTYMHGRGVGAPCSGRGICGTDGSCGCNEGYTGLACEKRVVMHGVCTPRERNQVEQEHLEKLQVARQEQAARLQAIALKRAELAALKEERARKAVAAGEAAGSASEEDAEDAELSAEMRQALEEQVRHHTAALNKPAMLPPAQLECICGTVPMDEAAFPGQMFRGPACDKRSCLNGCSGHGTCNGDGKCLCRGGWTGRDCSRAACPAACSYRGQCRLNVAVEHTVAGAMIASKRTRHTSDEEKRLAAELLDGAAHGDEVSAGEERPETLAGLVTGVAGLRHKAERDGERHTLADIARTLPKSVAGAEQLNNTAAMALGGNRPSEAEVNDAVEDIIENAVSPNEAAAYSEEGAAAAAEGAETEVEAATSGDEGDENSVFEDEASLLQRAAARATHRRRARHQQDEAEESKEEEEEEEKAAPKDDVSDLASSLERAEAASKRAEAAAEAAQQAAENAEQHASASAEGAEAATEASEDAAEDEAEEAEAEEGATDSGDEEEAGVEAGVNATLMGNLTGGGAVGGEAGEKEEEAAVPAAPVKTSERVLGDVVRNGAPAADAAEAKAPLTPAQRRKARLEQALEHGADPFTLGFPVTARCECDQGWGGLGCERRICPNKCSDHGVCDSEAQVCKCFEGWVGPACAVRADGGCVGGCGGPKRGKCIDGKCYCRATYAGPKCGKSVCKDDCNGKGVCNADDGTCKCLPGWAGELCSKKVCKNKCSDNGDCDKEEATCHCHAGWGGDDCSVKLFEQKKKEPEPKPEPSPSPAAKPSNATGEFVSLERPAHSVFGGTDVLMMVG